MDAPADRMSEAALCLLCRQPNHCQLCTTKAYKGPCWCEKMIIPDELLARVSPELRNKACLCRNCVTAFHQESGRNVANRTMPGDFYFGPGGLLVFTEA
jgi:hypothetical protein